MNFFNCLFFFLKSSHTIEVDRRVSVGSGLSTSVLKILVILQKKLFPKASHIIKMYNCFRKERLFFFA